MTTFKTATTQTLAEARTENGMKTYASSLNACVDLFFTIGASRGKNVTAAFERAFQENPEIAAKILLWSRDIRGGAGERQIFRDMLVNIEAHHKDFLGPIMKAVPELGRWDDLLVLKTDAARSVAFDMIGAALQSGDSLAGKWMPRKGDNAIALRKHLGWSPKQYRKTLVGLTNVVETQMCAKEWDKINFSHVPSVASSRYQTAFHRNADEQYQTYKDNLAKNDGSAKVNAGAVYPYDVLKPILSGGYGSNTVANAEVIKAQWDALPNYIGDESILPMVDTSGSMGCAAAGSLSCMDVAVSLGLYLADKNTGAFSDMFLTFSSDSHIQVLGGDIIAKVRQLRTAKWGMSTDLHAAFDEVLRVATQNKIDESDMPAYILILSDMQFNGHTVTGADESAMQMMASKYAAAGYKIPNIVFWNLNARSDQAPVKFDKGGTALVSGFSPAIMKSILAAENFTPEAIMLGTVDIPRYDIFN